MSDNAHKLPQKVFKQIKSLITEAVKEVVEDAVLDTAIDAAFNLVKLNKLTTQEIADCLNLPIVSVEILARSQKPKNQLDNSNAS